MSPTVRWSCLGLAACLACDDASMSGADDGAPPEVAELAACESVVTWPEPWSEAELAVLAEINALRAEGGTCGALQFAPAPPLRMHSALRCAARLHTADMIARAYISSVDPDGLGLGARLATVDYAAATFAEVVAVVTEDAVSEADDARDVVVAWRDNPTSCWQLYARELTHAGVGGRESTYTAKDTEEPHRAAYWTLSLAAPR